MIVHGTPTDFGAAPSSWADGTDFNRRVLARLVEQSPTRPSRPIRLLSCSTGAPGASAAQNLANKMGVDVLAPRDTLLGFDSERLTIGSTPNANTGQWVPFSLGKPR